MRPRMRLGARSAADQQYYALARILLASQPLAGEAGKLGEAVQAGIASTGSLDPDERAAGVGAVMATIGAMETAARTHTRSLWERIRP